MNGLNLKAFTQEVQEGPWAIYRGQVFTYLDPNPRYVLCHVDWFEQLGLPTTGLEFDAITRGRFWGDVSPSNEGAWINRPEIEWYQDTGTFEEFSDMLPTLSNALGWDVNEIIIKTLSRSLAGTKKLCLRGEDNRKWIGVDLDGTLAEYDEWQGNERIGDPIPKMLERVKEWLAGGKRVKIFTARADDPEAIPYIEKWLNEYGIGDCEITNQKDHLMEVLWDDRVIPVDKNKGTIKKSLSRLSFRKQGQEEDLFKDFYRSEDVLKQIYMMSWNLNTPPEVLAQLANDADKNVRGNVANNPNTSSEVLTQLANDPDEDVRHWVTRNPNTPLEILLPLVNAVGKPTRMWVARNPNTPPEVLVQLANDEDVFIRTSVAGNPGIPSEVLVQLANDKSAYIRYRVAQNPNTPSEVLTQLANDINDDVHWGAVRNSNFPKTEASKLRLRKQSQEEDMFKDFYLPLKQKLEIVHNPNTPSEVLAQLANDEGEGVQYWVIQNPNTPLEILTQLAKDKEQVVRKWIAANPRTPSEVLAQLANDPYMYVRYEVAENLNTPPEVLAQLANDPYVIMLRETREANNPNTSSEVLAQLANNENETTRASVARNPNTSSEVLAQLANDNEADVRRWVAEHPNTPSEVLAQLANDQIEYVCYWAIQNPNTPPEVLAQLANDINEDVRYDVISNPNFPWTEANRLTLKKRSQEDIFKDFYSTPEYKYTLEQRFKMVENPNTPSEVLAQLANDRSGRVRIDVANNPNTSSEVLAQLANDEEAHIRYAVAQNPNTPQTEANRLRLKKKADLSDAPTGIGMGGLGTTPEDYMWEPTDPQRRNNPKRYDKTRQWQGDDLDDSTQKTPEVLRAHKLNLRKRSQEDIFKDFYSTPEYKYTLEQRFKMSWNLNTPSEVLAQLSNDVDWNVREAVVYNQNTPSEVLAQLANDVNVYVRWGVAKNPNTPPETLAQLANDVYEEIRNETVNNPNFRSTEASKLNLKKQAQIEDIPQPWTYLGIQENIPGKTLKIAINDAIGSTRLIDLDVFISHYNEIQGSPPLDQIRQEIATILSSQSTIKRSYLPGTGGPSDDQPKYDVQRTQFPYERIPDTSTGQKGESILDRGESALDGTTGTPPAGPWGADTTQTQQDPWGKAPDRDELRKRKPTPEQIMPDFNEAPGYEGGRILQTHKNRLEKLALRVLNIRRKIHEASNDSSMENDKGEYLNDK